MQVNMHSTLNIFLHSYPHNTPSLSFIVFPLLHFQFYYYCFYYFFDIAPKALSVGFDPQPKAHKHEVWIFSVPHTAKLAHTRKQNTSVCTIKFLRSHYVSLTSQQRPLGENSTMAADIQALREDAAELSDSLRKGRMRAFGAGR